MSSLFLPYSTPLGCHDVPFIYLFNGNSLTNGNDYVSQLSIKTDADSKFVLRRIAGASSVGKFFSYRNASSSYVWKPPVSTYGPTGQAVSNQGDIGVLPEKYYPENGTLRFDLLGVAKAVAASGGTDFLAYIAFQGAKRFPYDVQEPPCAYRLRSYEYVIKVPSVTWTRGQFQRFIVKVDHGWDFELDSICQLNATNVPDIRVGVFNYMLYDPNRFQLMSDPVPDSLIVDQLNGILPTDAAPMPGVFPSPAVLYRFNTQIILDLYATESTPQGDCWQIVLRGMERIPT